MSCACRVTTVAVVTAGAALLAAGTGEALADPPVAWCDIVGTTGEDVLRGTDVGEVICGGEAG